MPLLEEEDLKAIKKALQAPLTSSCTAPQSNSASSTLSSVSPTTASTTPGAFVFGSGITPTTFDFTPKSAPSPKQEEPDWLAAKQTLKLASSVCKVLECPVCLEMVSAPARMCQRGHVTCASCVKQLTSCSVCRQPLLQEQPTCLNNLLEVLPRQCRYSDDGCKVVFVPGEDNCHEDFCRFRSMLCKEYDCKEKVKLSEIRQHFKNKHPKRGLFCKKEYSDIISKGFHIDKNYLNYSTPVTCMDNHIFYYKLLNDVREKHLKHTFEAYLLGKPECDYYAKFTFRNPTIEFTWSVKAILIKESEAENIADGLFCMRVLHSVLAKFMDENKLLHYSVAFSQSKS